MNINFKNCLLVILKKHNHLHMRGNGIASYETQHKRMEILFQFFTVLINMLGYKIQTPQNIGERHIIAVVNYWETQGIIDLPTRISVIRVFCKWIGKAGMVEKSDKYVMNKDLVRRKTATDCDKSWSGAGIDKKMKIAEVGLIDKRVAIILELMAEFGLRIKEAMLLRPHMAYFTAYLDVNRGTKGGRGRIAPILNESQHYLIERAKSFAPIKSDSMIPRGVKFSNYRKYFYRVCDKAGISRKNGIVPHGLRHEAAHSQYRDQTGANCPVKGGVEGAVDYNSDIHARQNIAENLGHSRVQITSVYCGPVMRQRKNKDEK